MGAKIPVTVVTGFLGSGKTTLLNRLLNRGRPGSGSLAAATVVLINELGDVALDHERLMHLDGRVVVLESGCICCTVRGDLVSALRQLFMDALQKKIPPFASVLIETTGIADPAAVMYTLAYDRFLADRYTYAGCVTVMDAVHGLRHMRERREAVQQAILADVFVVSKMDLVEEASYAAVGQALDALNPGTVQYPMQHLPQAKELLQVAADARQRGGRKGAGRLWSQPDAAYALKAHIGVGVQTMVWHETMTRSAFIRGLSCLLSEGGILRLKGKVYFQGEADAALVHAVHQQLYPFEAPREEASDVAGSVQDGAARPSNGNAVTVLVFIFCDVDGDDLVRRVDALLPGGARVVSSEGNFSQ